MPINKGGRGKKADYETKVIRVPLPIVDEVETLIQCFRDDLLDKPFSDGRSLDEAMIIASNILKSKKSAKESIRKLLQVLYAVDNIEL